MAFKVLVLNIGSASVKYSVYSDEKRVTEGKIERVINYETALKRVVGHIKKEDIRLDAIAHRVVHGGTISKPLIITKVALKRLDMIKELAPLHNPYQIRGIKVAMQLFDLPNIAVFDTAFHQTMPDFAYTYAIPESLSKKHGIRRYGFHGTSHEYVANEAAKLMRKPLNKLKMITCHLGNGCSITAVKHGRSVETSMGFTPLEGLVMGTRCGDLDPAIITFIAQKERMSPNDIYQMLNKKSGLLALSETSNDVRDLHASKSKQAKFALDVFCHRLTKYIGAYAAVMDGVDAIVFTAGIGENAWYVREKVMRNLGFLGLKIDYQQNKNNQHTISTSDSKVKAFVVHTNEALMIARKAKEALKGK